jgi:hypothetical protein
MSDEFESKFPAVGTVLVIGLPLFYLAELNDWWLAGGKLDPFAGCTTETPVPPVKDPSGNLIELAFTKCWWEQDPISHFLHNIFVNAIVPPWNLYVANPSGRLLLSGIVVVAYTALVGLVTKHLYTWFHTRTK